MVRLVERQRTTWLDVDPVGWQNYCAVISRPIDLYVQPKFRSQGIGTQIIKRCEQLVRGAGYNKLGLAVNPDLNPRAYALYQRLGYYAISQDKYLDGIYNGVEDWVIDLEKDLTSIVANVEATERI